MDTQSFATIATIEGADEDAIVGDTQTQSDAPIRQTASFATSVDQWHPLFPQPAPAPISAVATAPFPTATSEPAPAPVPAQTAAPIPTATSEPEHRSITELFASTTFFGPEPPKMRAQLPAKPPPLDITLASQSRGKTAALRNLRNLIIEHIASLAPASSRSNIYDEQLWQYNHIAEFLHDFETIFAAQLSLPPSEAKLWSRTLPDIHRIEKEMKNQLTTLANQPMGRKAERRIELMQEWKVVIDAWEKLWEENKKVHEVESRRERGERMEREERECVEIEMMHMRKEAVWQATGPKYLSSDQKKEELRLPEWLKRYAARVEDADEEDEDKKPVMHRFPY